MKKNRTLLYATIIVTVAVVLAIEAIILSRFVTHDGSETLFGIVPVPKWETPNHAEITFTKVEQPASGEKEQKRQRVTVKRKFISPDNAPLTDAQFSGTVFTPNSSSSLGGKVKPDGSFTFKSDDNAENVVHFDDRTGKWAAPPYTFSTFEPEKTEYELTIPLEPARHAEVTVRDKETGEPLPGIQFGYVALYDGGLQIGSPQRSRPNLYVNTDAAGKFRYTISTGEHLFAVASAVSEYLADTFHADDEDMVFAQKITVTNDSPETIEITFELPKLFMSRLLNPDGTPAKKQAIIFSGYAWNNEHFSTETDGDGFFQVHKTPEFVEMTVNSPSPYSSKGRENRLHLWFDKELSAEPEKYKEFRLQKPATIRARFIDVAGNPVTDAGPRQFRCYKPGGTKSDWSNRSYGYTETPSEVPGEFIFPYATPNVEYRFHGFGKVYRDDCLTATATESGQTLDFGDVVIASTPPASRPWTAPKQIPINLFDSFGKLDRFDFVTLQLYAHRITSRGPGSVTDGSYTKTVQNDERENWSVMGFRDPSNRWAAKPLVWSPTEDWDRMSDVRVDTEPGEMIRGIILDETTGKPIARMPILLVQKIAVEDDNAPPPHILTLEWKLTTDAEGRFAVRMVPGDFVVAIGDAYSLPSASLRKIWTRNVQLESGKPVDVEFRVSTPFVGQVLTTGGHPAPNTRVEVHWSSQQNTSYLQTDDRGEFRLIQVPEKFSYLTFESSGLSDVPQRLIRWIEPSEINPGGPPMVFRMSNIDVIGRMLDSAGNPLRNNWIIYVAAERLETTSNVQKYPSAPYYFTVSSSHDGLFRVHGLTPGVKYTLRYGGNPGNHTVIIIPAAKGNTINLGDITVE